MPNWCSNILTLTHTDSAEIKRAVDAFSRGNLMQEFYPCPQDLLDAVSGNVGPAGSPEQIAHEAKTAENELRYGYTDWYDWKVANWGTKWDVGGAGCDEPQYTEGDTSVTLYFDSAWTPPLEFYSWIEDMDFGVDALYYEPGVAFCGRYTSGNDDGYDITGDSDWVVENIPAVIDDAFGISEGMAEYESEQELDQE